MFNHLYKIECITNLHVGSSDVNYNVVDNEVEKDPVIKYPIIHSSGVKGALREYFKKKLGEEQIKYVFGQESGSTEIKAGSYKFFDANIITRPMRVKNSTKLASIPVFSVPSINNFINKINAFNCNVFNAENIDVDFQGQHFLTSVNKDILIESEATGRMSDELVKKLQALLPVIGSEYAVVDQFNDYCLPVIARNNLDNGESKNLWYEEFVPQGSVFYFIISTPTEENLLEFGDELVHFGGHKSIGYGFTKITKLN